MMRKYSKKRYLTKNGCENYKLNLETSRISVVLQ